MPLFSFIFKPKDETYSPPSSLFAMRVAQTVAVWANAVQQNGGQEEIRVDPEIFEPLVGQPNFASIHYNFDRSGLVANVIILDAQGRVIKRIINNEVLPSAGFFTWKGIRTMALGRVSVITHCGWRCLIHQDLLRPLESAL